MEKYSNGVQVLVVVMYMRSAVHNAGLIVTYCDHTSSVQSFQAPSNNDMTHSLTCILLTSFIIALITSESLLP